MAKKFKFKLESVLKLRSEKVDEAKNSFKTIMQYRYAKEEEIATLQNTKQDFLTQQHNITKASDMQANKDYVKNLDAQVEKKEVELEKIIEIENERRKRLNEAIKEEKIILKLKEKKYEEYKQELNKEETKFLDEIATNKFIKKSKK
jgi:flagellar FliJ protein